MTTESRSAEGPATADSARGVPEIHAHEGHRKYKVIDLDNKEIERTARDLVEGSKLLGNQQLWVANFRVAVERVRAWCQERAATVRLSLADVRSNKVMFYFVPEGGRYDLGLGDAMTDLEVELGGFGIGPVESLQVPDRSLDRFVSPRSLQIWEREGSVAS